MKIQSISVGASIEYQSVNLTANLEPGDDLVDSYKELKEYARALAQDMADANKPINMPYATEGIHPADDTIKLAPTPDLRY